MAPRNYCQPKHHAAKQLHSALIRTTGTPAPEPAKAAPNHPCQTRKCANVANLHKRPFQRKKRRLPKERFPLCAFRVCGAHLALKLSSFTNICFEQPL